MTKTTLAMALALSTALVAPALAQDANQQMQTQPDQQMQTQQAPAANDTTVAPAAPAATTATTTTNQAGAGQFVTQAQQGEYRASKFVGVDIYNNAGENVGEINDIILDKSGNARAVVIGVGGFLGIGEKNVALPFSEIQWQDQPRAVAANTAPPAATTGTGMATTEPGMANNTAVAPAAPGAATDTTGAVAANAMMRDTPDHGLLNMTKEQLESAPEFNYASEAQ